jgi:hypothetical protein
MNPMSRRFSIAAAVLVMALLPIAYVVAYAQLGEESHWEVCAGRGTMHVRCFSSERVAAFFKPLGRLESRFVQQTALAHKKPRASVASSDQP